MALKCGTQALTDRSRVCNITARDLEISREIKDTKNSTGSKRGQGRGSKSQKSCRTGGKLSLIRRNKEGLRDEKGKAQKQLSPHG